MRASRFSAGAGSKPRRAPACARSGSRAPRSCSGACRRATGSSRADVFAHTSRWEGFGIVLLEAMLAGLPVVATRVSAVPEIVEDGVTGILVPPDDAEAVAVAISRLLDDETLREQFGASGRRRALAEFSVAQMADRTLDVYDEALR